jgi:hypothetical protein
MTISGIAERATAASDIAAQRPTRSDWLLILVLLTLTVVPCFWTERAGTGDLLSHVYNVWLVQLIKSGQAPGLALASTHTNIFFDVALDHLVAWFGFALGTKIGLAIAVVVYSGGQIALWRTIAPRGWQAVSPLALMLSYGWLYAVGFINFYLALAFGYYAIALLWRSPRTLPNIASCLVLLGAAWLAHFVAVLMIVAIIAYVVVADRLSRRGTLVLFGASGVAIGIGHLFLRRYGNEQYAFQPQWRLGVEQVWLFSDRYLWFTVAVALVWVLGLASLVWRKRRDVLYVRVLQIYVLVALVAVLAPWGIRWISYSVTLGLLPGRITAIAAVFGCAIAARAQMPRTVLIATALVAIAFFAIMYRDQLELNAVETEIESVIHQLPRGSRVVSNVDWPEGRVQLWHLIDRACIGYAFDFGNYEASSGHFRIRVQPGNTLLTWVPPEVDPVSTAVLLRGKGIPVYEIYDDDDGHYHWRELNLSAMPDLQ